MAIVLHRSNRTEALVLALGRLLEEALPADPFVPFPVVVGSRGMERWLRHEIATRLEIAAGLAFPFPRQAIAGAARWLLERPEHRTALFWEPEPAAEPDGDRWEPDALAFRLVGLLRRRAPEVAFADVARYLGDAAGGPVHRAVTARELLFAGEVGDVLDRLMHDRPAVALEWAATPTSAPPSHQWLAMLLGDLGASTDPRSPVVMHRELLAAAPQPTGRTMCIFGLSTMGPGDRERLAAIARSIDVHLFVLVPTDRWFRTQRTRAEARAARRAAKTDADRQRTEAELASDNPILASLGAPSRDLQTWLEQLDYRGDELQADDPATGDAPSLLHRLQSWILSASGLDANVPTWPVAPNDSSLSAHSTFGALRQCEVLRDELLGMFAADPTLEPRDVVVMTPDIETFAPLVAAVFSRTGLARQSEAPPDESPSGPRLPRIPVAVADLGLRRTNPIAEVLLKILAVAAERLTASWLLDFLALEPVRRAAGLDDDDLADLRGMVGDAGLRWGLDAADRAAVGQPALDQNTARFAIERLALGVLMPDEGPLDVVPTRTRSLAGAAALEPAVPLEVQSRERAERVGLLAAMVRTIAAHREALVAPATLARWRTRLDSAIDELAATSEQSGWLRAEVEAALEELTRASAHLGELPVERAAVLRWLQGRFEIAQRGDRPITGAVQVCALEPMRSVPFRVVALVGMDDGAFPRGGRARTWDPLAEREPGERDRREIDRHLMLEAILSARERLLLFWSGHDVAQGKRQPAAVPVEELLETLGRLTGRTRAELVREHALQPWSSGNFAHEPQSFDQNMARAAAELREIEGGGRAARRLGLAASGTEPLSAEKKRPDTLELDELCDALLRPHKLLLRDRLGLTVSADEAAPEDREPLELDALQAWSVRSRMLAQLTTQTGLVADDRLREAVRARLAGEGILPPGAAGRAIVATEVDNARAVIANAAAIGGRVVQALELLVAFTDAPRLCGRAPHVRARGEELLLEWHTPSSHANGALLLRAWVHLLAAIASGHGVVGARLVGHGTRPSAKGAGGDFLVFDGGIDDARGVLRQLTDLWSLARARPLPLFAATSYAVAQVLHDLRDDLSAPGAHAKLVEAVSQGWHGGVNAKGDGDDPWIGAFLVDYEPADELDDESPSSLIGLARTVWLPLCRGLEQGRELAAPWREEVSP